MKRSRKIQEFLNQAKKSDSFWIESAKVNFAIQLEKQRKNRNIAYVEIAKKLDTSPAYISKVFRGDANLTIESMVKLSRAVEANLSVELTDSSINYSLWAAKFIKNHITPPASNNSVFISESTTSNVINIKSKYVEAA